MVLGFDKSEQILDKESPNTEICFIEYLKLLETEIFDNLSQSSFENMNLSNSDLEQVHHNCWMLFVKLKKEPQTNQNAARRLPEDDCYLLWRVFNFLAEEDENGIPLLPLRLHVEEAEILLNCFVEMTGHVALLSEIKPFLKGYSDGFVSFDQLEMAIVDKFSKNVKDSVLKKNIKDLFEKYIGDTLMKVCRSTNIPSYSLLAHLFLLSRFNIRI